MLAPFVGALARHVSPYARLARWDRPIGFWLLLLPCYFGQALAPVTYGAAYHLQVSFLFLIGAIAMRGAGCTWNDWLDRDLDAQVTRTAKRPLASGELSSKQALIFLILQCFIGLLVVVQLDISAAIVAVASLGLVALYPLAKRFMSVPQLILGAVFSWGALVGYVAQTTQLQEAALFLYMGTAAWIVGYDTLYALQDQDDDLALGIGSAAVTFSRHLPAFVGGCYMLCVFLFGAALWQAGKGWPSEVGLGLFAVHLAWQVWHARKTQGTDGLMLFRSNGWAGCLFLAGLLADQALMR